MVSVTMLIICLISFLNVSISEGAAPKDYDNLKDEIYKVSKAQNAIIYSRKLTVSEQDMLKKLRKDYDNSGISPEKELDICNNYIVDEEVHYCLPNGIFLLPDRELEEEDCLEIIDFQNKVDSIIQNRNQKDKQVASVPLLSEKNEITEMATDSAEKFSGISDLKLTSQELSNDSISMTFANETNNTSYCIVYDILAGSIYNISQILPEKYFENNPVVEMDQDRIYEISYSVVRDVFGLNEEDFDEAYIEYTKTGQKEIFRNYVNCFLIKGKEAYMVKYNFLLGDIYEITMLDYEYFLEQQKSNNNKLLSRNLTRIRIEKSNSSN